MDDLVKFIRAQLDEDEQEANDFGGNSWRVVDDLVVQRGVVPATTAIVAEGLRASVSEWLARHDPARVLREVAAKRAVVDLHTPVVLHGGPGGKYYDQTVVCRSCEPPNGVHLQEEIYPCLTLRLLAAVYADSPGYREEWRP